ncbi:hypothetical protein EOD39_15342 [Acipenser ruthenus]|uniref:Uncharacterized protein n=1 Tax=Acipenser ruthenus TaxID=7906 RepID=A0A662YJM2_ACIRT|nr:hypothetical protein EOD39_15342 [Acipenser ruthenus]
MLVTVSPGNTAKAPIPVVNITKHNITLGQRVLLGHLQPVKDVCPTAVRLLEVPENPPVPGTTPRQMVDSTRTPEGPSGRQHSVFN